MRCILCNELLTDHDTQEAYIEDFLLDRIACSNCLYKTSGLTLDFNTEQGYAEPIMRSEEA